MEEASVMMAGMNSDRILQGIVQLEKQKVNEKRNFRKVVDYSMPKVSQTVVRIILDHIDYVNRVLWDM